MLRPAGFGKSIARSILLMMLVWGGSIAYGDSSHHSVDSARRALEASEAALCQINYDISNARCALDAAVAQQSAAASNLSGALAQIDASQRCIAQAQAALDAQVRDIAALKDRADAARTAFEGAKARADAAAAEVSKYQQAAQKTFESSPAFVQVRADLQAAQNEYDRRVQATLEWLRSTDEYAERYDTIEELEEALTAERNRIPADPKALSAASMAWMDARSAMERFKVDYVNADPWVAEARGHLDAVARAQTDLVDRFNHDLGNDPQLKDLIAAADLAGQSAKTAADTANAVSADIAAREQEIAHLQQVIASETQRLAQAQSDAGTYQALANSASSDAVCADSWLRELWGRECLLRQQRDEAARCLRIALAQNDYYRDGRNYRGSDGRHGRDGHDKGETAQDERQRREERERRENTIATAEKSGRDDLTARHFRDRLEEQQRARLTPAQQASLDQRLTEQRRGRELERQRQQITADRAGQQQITAVQQTPAITASAALAAAPTLTPTPPVATIVAPTPAANAQSREEQQRRQLAEAQTREKAQADAKAQERKAAAAKPPESPTAEMPQPRREPPLVMRAPHQYNDPKITDDNKRQPETQSRAERERQQQVQERQAEQQRQIREAQAKEARERQEREAQTRQDSARREREAKPNDEFARRDREAQAREESARREREAQAREESARRERDSKAREDSERQQRETRAREESDRHQRETQAREDSSRGEREAQARQESDRRQRESQAREDSERRQRESQAREESDRRQRDSQARAEQDQRQRESEARRTEDSNRGRGDDDSRGSSKRR
jgi:hypothetical protein